MLNDENGRTTPSTGNGSKTKNVLKLKMLPKHQIMK